MSGPLSIVPFTIDVGTRHLTADSPLAIYDLPEEIVQLICSVSDIRSSARVGSTNKYLYNHVFVNSSLLWNRLVQSYFPSSCINSQSKSGIDLCKHLRMIGRRLGDGECQVQTLRNSACWRKVN